MARSNAQRIEFYQEQIDAIDDALAASVENAEVVTYTTPTGQTVTRDRKAARAEIMDLEKQIQRLQLRVSGPAVNLVRRGR